MEKNKEITYSFEICDYKQISTIAAEELALIDNVQYDQVKIPSGGGLAFEIADDEDSRIAKEIVGVIAYHCPQNAYWPDAFSGAGKLPDCSSTDGVHGIDASGAVKECSTCPLNRFGSRGQGKACKNMHKLFVLESGSAMPLVIVIPPTSLINFSNYVAKKIVNKKLFLSQCITKIGLKKAKSRDGIDYSELTFSLIGQLADEDWTVVQEMSHGIKMHGKAELLLDEAPAAAPAYDEDDDLPF